VNGHTFILVALWVACGVLNYGFYNGAHKAAEYAWCKQHYPILVIGFLAGPIAILSTAVVYGLKNWSWTPSFDADRREAWAERYGEDDWEDYERWMEYK
jgi:hypothetical protein